MKCKVKNDNNRCQQQPTIQNKENGKLIIDIWMIEITKQNTNETQIDKD